MARTETEELSKEDLDWVHQLLLSAQVKKWYGTVQIVMQGGEIKHVHKDETLLPPHRKGR